MDEAHTELGKRLDGLRADSEFVQQQIKVTTAVERKFYAAAYVWWSEASKADGFLTATYAQHGIKHNATRNSINWRPLLKLVTNGTIAKTDLDTWSKCFEKIHDDVIADPAHYANDPVGQIDYFVKINGGKTGLAGYHAKKQDELDVDDDDGAEATELAELEYTLDENEFADAFLQEATRYYAKSPAQALPANTPVHLTADSFGLAILRGDAAGVAFVTPNNLQVLVDTVMRESYRSDFSALPHSMRCVLEPLHIANVPLSIAKSIDRFTEYYMMQAETGGKEKTKASKRLVYRAATEDFLLSLSHIPSSVCIIAKPHNTPIKHAGGDLVLPAYVRRSIEVRLLHQRMSNMFAPAAGDAIPPTPYSSVTAASTPVQLKPAMIEWLEAGEISKAKALRYIRNLRHPPLAFVPVTASARAQRQAQPSTKAAKPTWTATVTQDWLRNATVSFFDDWIVEYGAKSNRAMNKVLSLTLDKTAMCIGYEFGKELGFSTPRDLSLPSGAATGNVGLITRSADFAFAMRQIADLPIDGMVALAASKEWFSIEFRTGVASYRVHIPSADEAGKRSTAGFAYYDLVAAAPHPTDVDEAEDSWR